MLPEFCLGRNDLNPLGFYKRPSRIHVVMICITCAEFNLDVEPILSKQTQFMEFEKLLNDAEMV